MKVRRRTLTRLAALAAATMALGLGACSGGAGSAKVANVTPGDMPESADWTGVYYSPLYGNIHLVQEGNTVSGKWLRPVKDRWAEIHGTVTGNLYKFTWTEYTIGAIGPNSTKKGKGYLVYSRPEGANVDDVVKGELGRDMDEVGDAIDGIKQRNVMPDLDSIGGTGATDIGGGDWDSPNREQGTPEAPAPGGDPVPGAE
jgi:hypothetical protein